MLDEQAHLRILVVDQSSGVLQFEPFEDQEIFIDRSGVVEVASMKEQPPCVRAPMASAGGAVSNEPRIVDLCSKEIQ